ncbi:hypothetical protein BH24ACT1_BH24ACT1_10670 [soil metagenome]
MHAAPSRQRAKVIDASRLVGWLAWVGLLLAVALGGRTFGRAALAPPALTDPDSWAGWASGRTPLEAAFAVLGFLVVVFAWYLLAVTTLSAGARLWGARRLVSVVDVVTLPVVRRSIHAVFGMGLVGTSMAGVASGVGLDQPVRSVAITSERVGAVVATEPDAEGATMADEGTEEGPPVMRLLPDEALAVDPIPTSPTGGSAESEWEVRPGDHLWSVAVQVLQRGGAVTRSDGEVAEYWNRLIVANTDRLADPGNPDLIFPGQVLTLPIPSPAGERALR